jgi:hypothetical protein
MHPRHVVGGGFIDLGFFNKRKRGETLHDEQQQSRRRSSQENHQHQFAEADH